MTMSCARRELVSLFSPLLDKIKIYLTRVSKASNGMYGSVERNIHVASALHQSAKSV
jgi:hypothetical protein